MSIIDDFMSQVIDLNETEKEETILFLANALIREKSDFIKRISKKVLLVVLPFLTNVATEYLKKEKKGGEKVGTGTRLEDN